MQTGGIDDGTEVANDLLPGDACWPELIGTGDPEALAKGVVAIDGFEPVVFGEQIDWTADPYGEPSWRFRFHSLSWLRPYLQSGTETVRSRLQEILIDWLEHNQTKKPASDYSWSDHSTALRAALLACATREFGQAPWLTASLLLHGEVLARPDFYRGRGNHALDQDIGLHLVASVLGRADWMALAETRMNELAYASIDDEGASNEGSVRYQLYNWERYGQAIRQVAASGRPVPGGLARQAQMPVLLAHATRPDGYYETIGDTWLSRAEPISNTVAEFAATQGGSGPRPTRRVAVFDAGYVFGRSGWGTERPFQHENFYSIRFGPSGIDGFHRHADHTSITWHPHGLPVLIDPGFDRYGGHEYRTRYCKAAEAHNVVVERGGEMVRTRETRLELVSVRDRLGEESYHLVGGPYVGVSRQRRLLVVHDPPMLVVVDELSSGRRRLYDQLWHFHPALDIHVRGGNARIEGNGITVGMVQLDAGASMQVVRGQVDPFQGWVSWTEGERVPAPTVVATDRGRRVRFVTVFAATCEVKARWRDEHLVAEVPGQTIIVALDDPLRVLTRTTPQTTAP